MPNHEDANASAIARLRVRRILTLVLFASFIGLMPLGLVCPCGIGIALRKTAPEGIVTTFYVLAFVLPLVGLAGTLLMMMDIGRYGRRLAVARTLDGLGMAYTEWPQEKQYAFARSLRLFAEQTLDSANNYFEGKYRGHDMIGMDYSFRWGYGRYQGAYTQTVVLLQDAVPGVPNFVLSPRGILDRISPWLSKDRIELEGEEDFNRRFALSGGLRQDDIAECFTSKVVDLCLEDATISLEVFSGDLIVCRQGRTIPASDYQPLFDHAVRLAKALAPPAA